MLARELDHITKWEGMTKTIHKRYYLTSQAAFVCGITYLQR